MQARHTIHPMSSGEVIRHGFAIWRKAPFRLGLINLPEIIARVFLLGMLFIVVFYNQYVIEGLMEPSLPAAAGFLIVIVLTGIYLAILFLLMLLNYFPFLAMVFAASNVILRRPVSIWQSFRRAFSRRVFGKFALFSILIVSGLLVLAYLLILAVKIPIERWFQGTIEEILLAILIFYLLISVMDVGSFLFLPILALEKKDFRHSARRLVAFLKEYGRHILWTYFLSYWLPFTFTATPIILWMYLLLGPTTHIPRIVNLVFLGLTITFLLISLLFSSLGTVVMVLSYYDVRSRKERYDEEVLAEEMGYAPLAEMIGL